MRDYDTKEVWCRYCGGWATGLGYKYAGGYYCADHYEEAVDRSIYEAEARKESGL